VVLRAPRPNDNKFVGHGDRRGNTVQALTQWRHPVASSEALDMLYQAMQPASYRCITMAIKITSNFHAFFLPLIFCCARR